MIFHNNNDMVTMGIITVIIIHGNYHWLMGWIINNNNDNNHS
jgi:hypothetical protein